MSWLGRWAGSFVIWAGWLSLASAAAEIGRGEVFSVVELNLRGPRCGPTDAPARDIELSATLVHESGGPRYRVWGFWDGDGRGGHQGDVFQVRFCPTKPGRWNLVEVSASVPQLRGQRQGDYVSAVPSQRRGFWIVDPQSPGCRWYMRSDGSHQYVIGNTHYSFLSGYDKDGKPRGNDIAADVAGNAKYFKKLRFALTGDRYPHPQEKPFLDDQGRPTDEGDNAHRPNPRWFHQRVDLAVRTAWENDLIADLILAGPDSEAGRSTLRAGKNGGDAGPLLKYVAARYGSYPNVWICLCNEYEIKNPKYSEEQIAHFGQTMRRFLPYPTPLSVHATPRTLWSAAFDQLPPWADHQIIQNKIKNLPRAADVIQQVWQGGEAQRPRNSPTIDDELSYQGAGDKHREADTIEAHLGAFLGGGYGTTGEKSGNKEGQYFGGRFDPAVHSAADNLRWLRETIDAQITFWRMAPDGSIFGNLAPDFRGLAWPGQEYVLGTNAARRGIVATLPPGRWQVTQYDVMTKQASVLTTGLCGEFTFDAPDSRAALFHFRRLPSEAPRKD
jgi:hypothetical protein